MTSASASATSAAKTRPAAADDRASATRLGTSRRCRVQLRTGTGTTVACDPVHGRPRPSLSLRFRCRHSARRSSRRRVTSPAGRALTRREPRAARHGRRRFWSGIRGSRRCSPWATSSIPPARLGTSAVRTERPWGRVRGKTRPVPGNHEYREPWARGYFRYFGARAGPHGKGWYAYRPERPRDLRPSSRRWSVPDWLPPLAAMGPSTPASRLRAAVLGVESPCDGHELGRSAIRAPLLRRAPPTGLTPGGLGRRPGQ
jgi:hypothetical protein